MKTEWTLDSHVDHGTLTARLLQSDQLVHVVELKQVSQLGLLRAEKITVLLSQRVTPVALRAALCLSNTQQLED